MIRGLYEADWSVIRSQTNSASNRRKIVAQKYIAGARVISAGREVLLDWALPTGDSENNNNLILRKCGL